MASENAKRVAQKVLETIGRGEKVNLGAIARESGYADNTADNPKLITETKTYKEAVSPVVERMEKERDRIIKALETKDLGEERYRDLVDGLDKLTKNIQLLNGGVTERQGLKITFDEAFNQ